MWRRTQLRTSKIQGIVPLPWRDPSIRALVVNMKQLEGDTMKSVHAEFHGIYGGYDMLQFSVAIQQMKEMELSMKVLVASLRTIEQYGRRIQR